MPLTLRSGGESRLDGAPSQDLPNYADMVEAVSAMLFARDPARYGGEKANARDDAIAYITQQEAAKRDAEASRRAQAQKEIAGRDQARQDRLGVDPDALPYATSARDVQEANRPRDEAEAALEMEQKSAADIIRGSREGQRDWEAESDLAYLRERGEQNPLAPEGQRDLDVRRRWMEGKGRFYEMPDGARLPVGRDPTAAELRNPREFEGWANETPGTERQARYAPEAYAEWQEARAQEIQNRARQDMETYGGRDPSKWTDEQKARRDERAASEDRVYNSDWHQRRRQERLAARAGLSPEAAAMQIDFANVARNAGMRPEERLEESLRVQGNLRRLADQQARRDLVAQRGELRGAGLSPAVGDTRNRFDSLIDRLGQAGMNDWQRAGLIAGLTPNAQTANPTPLGVDAMGAQNAMRFINNEAIAGMDPLRREAAQAQMEQQLAGLPPEQKLAISIARREPMGTGLSTGPVNAAWNDALTEQGFREKMEGAGYQPAEIDTWIDARRNGPAEGPPVTGRAAPPPGGAQPSAMEAGLLPPVAGRGGRR